MIKSSFVRDLLLIVYLENYFDIATLATPPDPNCHIKLFSLVATSGLAWSRELAASIVR